MDETTPPLVSPRREAYDVIVVGGGIGGLVAGALLARAGKRVLVAERHDRPGGYAHGFDRDGYRFDVAVHMTSGGRRGFLARLLGAMGAGESCDFTELDPIYTVSLPGFSLNVRAGLEGFVTSHIEHFPREQDGVIAFLRLCAKANREAVRLPADLAWLQEGIDRTAYPLHHGYSQATLAEVVDQHVVDPRLKTLLTSMWIYQGLPPSRLSFLPFASMLISYLASGSYYCRGSFQQLANAFAGALTRHGGELVLNAHVERICTEAGAVSGIELGGGVGAAAPVVISNVDARQTFERLLDPAGVPAGYLATLRSLKPSVSAVALYLGTSAEVELGGAAHEIIVYDDWDYDEVFRRVDAALPAAVAVSVPSKVDAALAPPGTDAVGIMGLAPFDPDPSWDPARVTSFQDAMIDAAGTAVPGLAAAIALRIGGYPGTLERYTLNHQGALYGWAQSPEQSSGYRLQHRTPVAGLMLAGHWSQPGGGVVATAVSGAQVAQLVLEHDDLEGMLGALGKVTPVPGPA